MRTVAALVVAVLALGSARVSAQGRAGGPPPTAALAAPAGTGAISGVVTDASTGRPVAGAIVSLGSTTGGAAILTLPRTTTDPKGRFLFRNLAPSTRYYLRASRIGYAAARYGAAGPMLPSPISDTEIRTVDDISTIAVAAGQWVSDVKVSLWRLGTLSGRVLDERGEPLVGVAVRGFSAVRIAGRMQYVGSDVGTTDDRGEYRLANLTPGRYAVAVLSVQSTVPTSTPQAPQRRAVGELLRNPSGGAGGGLPAIDVDEEHRLALGNYATPPPPNAGMPRAYPAVFYPGTPTLATAQLVEVGYGTARRGMDFQLHPVQAVKVSGRLQLPPGSDPRENAPPLLLRLMPAGNEQLGAGSEAATTVVDRDGSFTLLNVPAGEYTLLAQAVAMELTSGGAETRLPGAQGAQSDGASLGWLATPGLTFMERGDRSQTLFGRTAVTVRDEPLAGLVLPLQRTVSLRGRFAFADGGRPNGLVSVMVMAQPATGDPTLGRPSAFVTIPDADTFTLDGLTSGTYLVGVALGKLTGLGVVSVTSNGRDLRDTGLDTSTGVNYDDVIVTLTNKKIEVSGTVHGPASPVAAAVIAFPVDRARWIDYGWDPDRIQSRSVDTNGAFVLTGLPEGDYFVIAVDPSLHDAWTDPAFLDAASTAAKRISLTWGDRKTIELTLSKVAVK